MTNENKLIESLQKAKDLIDEKLDDLYMGYWQEPRVNGDLTEKQVEKIQARLEKRVKGLRKYLGL